MFKSNVNLVVVSQPGIPDSAEEIHPTCYREGDQLVQTITDEIPDNYRCDRCRKFIGKFVTDDLLSGPAYEELVTRLLTLDGEDLINVFSRVLQLRGDIKQSPVVGNAEGHYEQASMLHYTPEPAEDGHNYPARVFEIVVMERDIRNVPAHLLSN